MLYRFSEATLTSVSQNDYLTKKLSIKPYVSISMPTDLSNHVNDKFSLNRYDYQRQQSSSINLYSQIYVGLGVKRHQDILNMKAQVCKRNFNLQQYKKQQ